MLKNRKTKIILILLPLLFPLLFINIAFSQESPSQKQQKVDATWEKLLVIRQRNQRDLDKAEQLRIQALTQIKNAKMIMKIAKENPDDLYITSHREALQLAPAALKYGEEVLAGAEESIEQAKLKLGWTDRALKNLDELKAKNINLGKDVGMAVPVQQKGSFEIIPKGEYEFRSHPYKLTDSTLTDYLLPGDQIVTKEDSFTHILTTFSSGYGLYVGPNTSLALVQDNRHGTVWYLSKGKIHFTFEADEEYGRDEKTPIIKTPDSEIECNLYSTFDVYIDEKGKSHVQVHKGNVKITGPDEIYQILRSLKGEKELPWWKYFEKHRIETRIQELKGLEAHTMGVLQKAQNALALAREEEDKDAEVMASQAIDKAQKTLSDVHAAIVVDQRRLDLLRE